MRILTFLFHSGLVLGFALFAPVALPAGGGELQQTESYFNRAPDPLVLVKHSSLRASPQSSSPVLRTLDCGTPLNILRLWEDSHGKYWLKVQVASFEDLEINSKPKRGWVSL